MQTMSMTKTTTTTNTTANAGSNRPTPLATLILGLGAALAVTLATPVDAASKGEKKPTKPEISAPARIVVEAGASVTASSIGKPANTAAALPPDPCAAGPEEYDCNQNGINDLCDIADGWADANEDGILDDCQFMAGDLDLDGFTGAQDLAILLNGWGSIDAGGEGGDANGDGFVDGFDLAIILSNWST